MSYSKDFSRWSQCIVDVQYEDCIFAYKDICKCTFIWQRIAGDIFHLTLPIFSVSYILLKRVFDIEENIPTKILLIEILLKILQEDFRVLTLVKINMCLLSFNG